MSMHLLACHWKHTYVHVFTHNTYMHLIWTQGQAWGFYVQHKERVE